MLQIARSEGRFVAEDWHNFGAGYDRTLLTRKKRFMAGWPELKGKIEFFSGQFAKFRCFVKRNSPIQPPGLW